MKKVYVVGGGFDYWKLFESMGYERHATAKGSDLIVFTGGEDVTPSLYGDMPHHTTGNDIRRDAFEIEVYEEGLEQGTNMVGICRGGQFLNVMNGGRMYQHVSDHTKNHEITDARTGQKVWVTSTHHQMMMPAPDALLVATAALGGTREWYDGITPRRDVSDKDIEVLYYEKTKCLCFQPHPEFSVYGGYEDMATYFKGLMKEFFGD